MSKPRRTWIIIGTVVILLAGLEFGLESLRPPDAAVRIINEGETPIIDLKLTYGDSSATVLAILPQDSVVVRLSGRGMKPLKLNFHQLDNAMTGFEVKDFDPAELRLSQSMLVLEIRSNEFVRHFETDPTPTTLGRLRKTIGGWVGEETEPEP